MELIKVISARNTLDEFSDKEDIPARLSYWMTKFVVKTESEHEFYSSGIRKLLDKFADKKDDGTMSIPEDKISDFDSAVEELNKTDVEEPGIRFKLSELSSELKMSMKQMYPLLDFIDEDK